MAVARLKGDPRIGITGMRKRIFPDGDTMKEKVHKVIQQLVEVERFKFYKDVDINSLMAMAPIGVSGGRGVKDKEVFIDVRGKKLKAEVCPTSFLKEIHK